MTIHPPIREARVAKGMAVAELAMRVGCSPKHIENIEASRERAGRVSVPSIGLMHAIGDVLGVEFTWVFTPD
jgi:transcriptional regulator with XRE-family HTH domain